MTENQNDQRPKWVCLSRKSYSEYITIYKVDYELSNELRMNRIRYP